MTYAALMPPFLVAAIILVVIAYRRERRGWAGLGIGLAVILVLTIVFDSIMILVDLFRYDDDLLLGLTVGAAPIEDLSYAVVAVLVVASIWRLLPRRQTSRSAHDGTSPRAPLVARRPRREQEGGND